MLIKPFNRAFRVSLTRISLILIVQKEMINKSIIFIKNKVGEFHKHEFKIWGKSSSVILNSLNRNLNNVEFAL